MKQLSIIIPGRNEMFLARTIQDILEHKEADAEIIAVLDGQWANPPIPQHPDVNVIYVPESIGQRKATNLGVRLSKSKYIIKCDAHCAFDRGFDQKMIEFMERHGEDVTAVPIMRNLWVFDWKCLTEGTKIVTPNGLKNIEEIKEGDEIISGDGKPHKVLKATVNKPTSPVVRVKPYQLPAMELTADHLVKVYPYEYVKTTKPNSHKTIISEKEQWVEAGKLKDGLYKMIYPFSQEESGGISEDLARFLGYFMAEGNFYHKNPSGEYMKMTLCFNQDEDYIVNDIERIIGDNFKNRYGKRAVVKRFKKIDKRSGYKYMRVNVYSQEATKFFRKLIIGGNARNKKFTNEVLQWPKSLQRVLLNAMIEGDGWKGNVRETPIVAYDTSSKELSNQVFTLMIRLGFRPGITEKINNGSFGCGRPSYSIRAYESKNNHKGVIRGNECLVSICKVEKSNYSGLVYDLTIDGLPEILTESGVVHNCYHCGWKKYQGPTPEKCPQCGKGDKIRKKMMWVGKHNPQSWSYCFDSEPHFRYFEEYKHRSGIKEQAIKKGWSETMSLQGSFFMATREKYWELELSGEEIGSWGNQGIEVACKTWLSGGRVLVNHNTWYAHLFRTQGGDFGFPYPQSGREVQKTKQKTWDMFFGGFEQQIHPVSWLIKKFWPVNGWTDESLKKLEKREIII